MEWSTGVEYWTNGVQYAKKYDWLLTRHQTILSFGQKQNSIKCMGKELYLQAGYALVIP